MTAISKLGVGPMSEETMEAVFRYSEKEKTPLMLIASKNQIDWNGGYVNNWTTQEYGKYIQKLKKQHAQANVYICRDHCGPNFKQGSDLGDVYKTIDADMENDFDLIHIDFCHLEGYRNEIFEKSKIVIEYILNHKPGMLIEVGTDENRGTQLNSNSQDIHKIEEEMKFFTEIAPIHFFVSQTGSLVKEINQVGNFNHEFIQLINQLADVYKLNLKEHNADYISSEKIALRGGLVDAVNVAPQYGVLQTQLTLNRATTYGIDITDFLNTSYESKKWEKWMHKNDKQNKYLCSIIAGHYNFHTDTYKKLYEKINQHENFRESIITELQKNINLYIQNL